MGTTDGMELDPAARQLLEAVGVVVPHTDADGLAAGAGALRFRGEGAADAVLLGRGQTPFGRVPPLPEASVAVLDWGVRPLARPGILVDHHAPETEAGRGQLVVSGYGEVPEVSTAPLVKRILPETPAWLAAVGAVGDLGDRAWLLDECRGAPKTAVRKLVPLINAPRRLPEGPVLTALELLVEHEDIHTIFDDPRLAELEKARETWKGELSRVMRVAPKVDDGVAVIRFRSACQVHPLVATAWMRRLAPALVIAANEEYLPGRINFSVRGGFGDLRQRLQEALPGVRGEFAHGHDQATGGSLTYDQFDEMVRALRDGKAPK